MPTIEAALNSVFGQLSNENYAESLAFYHFWCGTGGAYLEIPSDQIFDAIWNHRGATSSISPTLGKIFHASADLIVRFAKDAESDHILAPYSSGLQGRLCARTLREFSSENLMIAWYTLRDATGFYADVNLLAHWVNLGFVEEAAIRNHILQSLISHPKRYCHQVWALIILFKIAGATFEAYVEPSVVDRCFEHLKAHSAAYSPDYDRHGSAFAEKRRAIQVRVPCVSNGGRRTKVNFRGLFKSWSRYGSVAGKVSLPHLCSRLGSLHSPVQTRETLLQLPLPHPSDFLTEFPNLRSPRPLRWNRPPSQSQLQFPNFPSLPSSSRRQSASPLSLTSQSRMVPMMNLPSTPRSLVLWRTTIPSTALQ